MPADRVLNFDGEGEDTNKGRSKVIAAKSLSESGLHRVFEVAQDNMPFHVTMCGCISAEGTFFPAPVIIHSAPANEDPVLTHAESDNIYVRGEDGEY